MQKLPIDDVLDELRDVLMTQNRVVLQAPPGAGKTTAVPIALLDQTWLGDRRIIILEPRRLAARNAAARMADLLSEKVGKTVGYQIRQDSCFTDNTKILVVTEGILTRKLQADPALVNTALVIFDEFHERNLHADLSLALCLQSQDVLREDLKILVMSATLNTQAISGLLAKAPIIQSEGYSYPVEIHYLEQSIKPLANTYVSQQQMLSALTMTVKNSLQQQQGSCLVFLPGVKEINQLGNQLKTLLQKEFDNDVVIAPLHGSLSKQQQDKAIAIPPKGTRKIVLATNIAETSLTIEGISIVIDSGLERVSHYNPTSGMNGLETRLISVDSATQRSGRAGRLGPGVCYRLWTQQEQQGLRKHSSAEILHSDLSSLVLELANWGVKKIDDLQWLDTPPISSIEQASELLQRLRALDEQRRITQHGRDMLGLGTHPRLAHMILSAVEHRQSYHACLIAAILTEKDLFLAKAEKSADIHDRLSILREYTSDRGSAHVQRQDVDVQQCARIIQTADDFFKRLQQYVGTVIKEEMDANFSGILLAYAYPDRIAQRRNINDARYLLSNGKGAVIPAHLQHYLSEYLVIANLDASNNAVIQNKTRQNEAVIRLAADIALSQLEEFFSELIVYTETVVWDEASQRVECRQVEAIGKITLKQTLVVPVDKSAVQECLLSALTKHGLSSLNWTPNVITLQQRVNFINYQMAANPALKAQIPDAPIPDFSQEELLATLSDWLQPHLTNESSIKQCQKLDIYNILINQMSWGQQKWLSDNVPEKITVPSGSTIRIDYSDPAQPVLAVRLQEVFGLYDTPALLNGHCKVMMHLLSPRRQPMQVTQDLRSFWQTAYHEVKKELRGKYKRHYWPDDPLTAQATSKTKKNM